MVLSIVRWLKGTVTFVIIGMFPERLVSLCQNRGIPLWNIKREDKGIKADTYASNYKGLRHGAKHCGVKIRIAEKRGAFVWMHRYRKRKGIVPGILTSVILLVFCSTRVWSIKVSGCSEELANAVRYELAENGVTTGCRKNTVDVKSLQKKIMLNDRRIAWIAVNLVGSTAFVEVSEAEPPPEPIDPSGRVANIVAECDGQIKYLEVYDGQLLVKVGETVSKGDVIVSGIMEDQYGKKQMKYARAKVIARVNEEIRADVPLCQMVWQPCGEAREKWYLSRGEKLLPVSFGKLPSAAYSVSEQRSKLLFWDIVKKTYTPQQPVEQKLTETQAKEYAMQLLDVRDISGEEKLITRSRKAQLLNGIYSVTENRQLEKDIAKTVEIEWVR